MRRGRPTEQQFNVLSPVCSPSRVAAMTGRCPARYLKAAGYRTRHFGKWHMGDGGPAMADYGIDESAVYGGLGPKWVSANIIGERWAEKWFPGRSARIDENESQ